MEIFRVQMAKRKCSELEHVVAGRSEQNSPFDSDNEKRAADYAKLRAMLGEAVMQYDLNYC